MTCALADPPEAATVLKPIELAAPALRRPASIALSALLTLLLWPALAYRIEAPNSLLDPSWQEVLIHAHDQGWQFGRDIIFTSGPWGYLLSRHHLGETLAVSKLV